MQYTCLPNWVLPKDNDPFDYPLRNIDDIEFEHFVDPPNFPIMLYMNGNDLPNTPATVYNIPNEVELMVKLTDLPLTGLQKQRLVFLLGNRYQNDNKIRIKGKMFDNYEDNLDKAIDILKQLYFEAKRAPLFKENLSSHQYSKLKRKYLGKNKEIRQENETKILELTAQKETNYKKFQNSNEDNDIKWFDHYEDTIEDEEVTFIADAEKKDVEGQNLNNADNNQAAKDTNKFLKRKERIQQWPKNL